jgi:hypothetical protein
LVSAERLDRAGPPGARPGTVVEGDSCAEEEADAEGAIVAGDPTADEAGPDCATSAVLAAGGVVDRPVTIPATKAATTSISTSNPPSHRRRPPGGAGLERTWRVVSGAKSSSWCTDIAAPSVRSRRWLPMVRRGTRPEPQQLIHASTPGGNRETARTGRPIIRNVMRLNRHLTSERPLAACGRGSSDP